MKKIAVVGGGISGLTIACLLVDQKEDLEIAVYEADNRPGGKIWSEHVGGF